MLLGRHYLRNNLIKNLILIKCHVNYYSFKILLWVILSLWSSGSSHPNYTFYNYNFLFCFLLVGGTLDTKGLIKSWDWWCTKGKGKVNRFYRLVVQEARIKAIKITIFISFNWLLVDGLAVVGLNGWKY